MILEVFFTFVPSEYSKYLKSKNVTLLKLSVEIIVYSRAVSEQTDCNRQKYIEFA